MSTLLMARETCGGICIATQSICVETTAQIAPSNYSAKMMRYSREFHELPSEDDYHFGVHQSSQQLQRIYDSELEVILLPYFRFFR